MDEDGNLIPNAQVRWTDPSKKLRGLTPDGHGAYKLSVTDDTIQQHAGWGTQAWQRGLSVEGAEVFGHCETSATMPLEAPNKSLQIFVRPAPTAPLVDGVSDQELLEAYRHIQGRGSQPHNFDKIKKALSERKPAHEDPAECRESNRSPIRARLIDKGLINEDEIDDVPYEDADWFETAHFAVKYAYQGEYKLRNQNGPGADEELTLWDNKTKIGTIYKNATTRDRRSHDGIAPKIVQEVGVIAEYALGVFGQHGLTDRMLRNAGASKLAITIRKIPERGATSPAWPHLVINVANDRKQNLITVPHELFHRIQYSYNADNTRKGLRGMFIEGGAMLAADGIDDTPNCYAGYGQDWLSRPDLSLMDLESAKKSSPLSHAAGIFWKFFVEQCSPSGSADGQMSGIDAYKSVLERVALDGFSAVSRTSCAPRRGASFQDVVMDHLVAQYLVGMPSVKALRPFQYDERDHLIACPDKNSGRKLSTFKVQSRPDVTLVPGTKVVCDFPVATWSAHIGHFKPTAPGQAHVHVKATAPGCMVRVVRVGRSGEPVVEPSEAVPRHLSAADLESLGVVATCQDKGGNLHIEVEATQ